MKESVPFHPELIKIVNHESKDYTLFESNYPNQPYYNQLLAYNKPPTEANSSQCVFVILCYVTIFEQTK